MTTSNKPTRLDTDPDVTHWYGVSLPSTLIAMNGYVDGGIPDEVFLGPPGEQVEILRTSDGWEVTGPLQRAEVIPCEDFQTAFTEAVKLLREYFEVEE